MMTLKDGNNVNGNNIPSNGENVTFDPVTGSYVPVNSYNSGNINFSDGMYNNSNSYNDGNMNTDNGMYNNGNSYSGGNMNAGDTYNNEYGSVYDTTNTYNTYTDYSSYSKSNNGLPGIVKFLIFVCTCVVLAVVLKSAFGEKHFSDLNNSTDPVKAFFEDLFDGNNEFSRVPEYITPTMVEARAWINLFAQSYFAEAGLDKFHNVKILKLDEISRTPLDKKREKEICSKFNIEPKYTEAYNIEYDISVSYKYMGQSVDENEKINLNMIKYRGKWYLGLD